MQSTPKNPKNLTHLCEYYPNILQPEIQALQILNEKVQAVHVNSPVPVKRQKILNRRTLELEKLGEVWQSYVRSVEILPESAQADCLSQGYFVRTRDQCANLRKQFNF